MGENPKILKKLWCQGFLLTARDRILALMRL